MAPEFLTGVERPDPAWIARQLPDGDFRRIVLKPNWVLHESSPEFPIRALVTSAAMIEAVLEACLEKYRQAESITVGDVPLQGCDFERMLAQSGADRVAARFAKFERPRVIFRDWRRERFISREGFLQEVREGDFGDRSGYREIALDGASLLDPISAKGERFRVSDYDVKRIQSSHRAGHHRYLFSGSALASDLFVNLPKMKTHQKSGITGALKNLVGCNGEKAFLVHYLRGLPGRGGDEFPPDIAWPVVAQVRVREALQKRSKALFAVLRPAWRAMKKLYGIQTEGTRENLGTGRFYMAAGAWYGNDTIWRMVYDLNRIIRYAPPGGGALAATPQRDYVAILDGIVAGEGNGPLQPLPVEAGVVAAARDPFALDALMARLMGFDPARIPLLARRGDFADPEWGRFDDRDIDAPTLKTFLAPPGWRGHIER